MPFAKRGLCLFVILAACSLNPSKAFSQNAAALDSLGGLFGVRLDQHMNRMPHQLAFVKRVRGTVLYDALPGTLTYAHIRFERIRFTFYRDQLMGVEFRTSDVAQSDSLLAYLERILGPGRQDGYAPHYIWHGRFVWAEYDQNLLTKTAVLSIQSFGLRRLYEADLLK